MNCGVIQTGRVVPIVSLGKVSSNVQNFAGASTIDFNTTYDDLQASRCTSCDVHADKSGYWTPQLSYEHSDGRFEVVGNQGLTVYYHGSGDDAANITPFPPGFRMVSGDPSARSYNTSAVTHNGNRLIADRVNFACNDMQSMPETTDMKYTQCAKTMKAQVHFQSCWNGHDIYTEDNSHVAYMSGIDNGVCPATHPVQLLHLTLEVLYSLDSVKQDGGRFVFADGDLTGKLPLDHTSFTHRELIADSFPGYGFYGGFINGWDSFVQASAIAQCATGNPSGAIQSCAPLNASRATDDAKDCPSKKPVVDDQTFNILPKLPDYVKATPGPEDASLADKISPAFPAAGRTKKELRRSIASNPVIIGYVGSYVWDGCFAEGKTGRALNDAQYLDTIGMTVESCVNFCQEKGCGLAGVEFTQECHCGAQIVNGGVMVSDGECNMACKGNAGEICGGDARLGVYLSG